MRDVLELFVRFAEAVAAGLFVGVPSSRQPGGIRTHALVAVGAVLFCATARAVADADADADLLRVVAGVATGVGFIGGAAVLKHGGAIRGVNASASIWIAAALGCLVAFVDAVCAAGVVVAVGALNLALSRLERALFNRHRRRPRAFTAEAAVAE